MECYCGYKSDDDKAAFCSRCGNRLREDERRTKLVRYVDAYPELENPNLGKGNSGRGNKGNYNSGDNNNGDYNSGDNNTGNYNSGNNNWGDYNIGHHNVGCNNIGNYNMYDGNSGHNNFGCGNLGHGNLGYVNTGVCNRGDENTGSFNIGSDNIGWFNTEEIDYSKPKKIRFFDKEINISMLDWHQSKAHQLFYDLVEKVKENESLYVAFQSFTDLLEADLSEVGNDDLISAATTFLALEQADSEKVLAKRRAFLRGEIIFHEIANDWWNNLAVPEKEEIKKIPNFDAAKFSKIMGIPLECI